jgi:hypothetical protein
VRGGVSGCLVGRWFESSAAHEGEGVMLVAVRESIRVQFGKLRCTIMVVFFLTKGSCSHFASGLKDGVL